MRIRFAGNICLPQSGVGLGTCRFVFWLLWGWLLMAEGREPEWVQRARAAACPCQIDPPQRLVSNQGAKWKKECKA